MFDPTHLQEKINNHLGSKPHPALPEVTVDEYRAFSRAASQMFDEARPSVRHVETAHHSLTQAGISLAEFDRLYPLARPLSTGLLDRDPTLHDLRLLQGASPGQVRDYYRDHPHPEYPNVSAGEIHDYATMALYPARRIVGREPNLYELHKFAVGRYSSDDIVAHYSDRGSGVRQ